MGHIYYLAFAAVCTVQLSFLTNVLIFWSSTCLSVQIYAEWHFRVFDEQMFFLVADVVAGNCCHCYVLLA